jgi:hypothetical protein
VQDAGGDNGGEADNSIEKRFENLIKTYPAMNQKLSAIDAFGSLLPGARPQQPAAQQQKNSSSDSDTPESPEEGEIVSRPDSRALGPPTPGERDKNLDYARHIKDLLERMLETQSSSTLAPPPLPPMNLIMSDFTSEPSKTFNQDETSDMELASDSEDDENSREPGELVEQPAPPGEESAFDLNSGGQGAAMSIPLSTFFAGMLNENGDDGDELIGEEINFGEAVTVPADFTRL